jgi:hypothetical protein
MVRITRTVLKVIILFIQLSLTLVSVLGTLSSFLITSSSNNIYVGTPVVNAVGNSTIDIKLPFVINNTGLYDFTDMTLNVTLKFYNISEDPNTIFKYLGVNDQPITIPAGENYYDASTLVFTGIDISDIPNPTLWEISLIIEITSFYSLDLILFKINLNITVEGI